MHSNHGTEITWLVQVRIIVGRNALAGVVADVVQLLLVLAVVTAARDPNLLALQERIKEVNNNVILPKFLIILPPRRP